MWGAMDGAVYLGAHGGPYNRCDCIYIVIGRCIGTLGEAWKHNNVITELSHYMNLTFMVYIIFMCWIRFLLFCYPAQLTI